LKVKGGGSTSNASAAAKTAGKLAALLNWLKAEPGGKADFKRLLQFERPSAEEGNRSQFAFRKASLALLAEAFGTDKTDKSVVATCQCGKGEDTIEFGNCTPWAGQRTCYACAAPKLRQSAGNETQRAFPAKAKQL
jgi:hypothetical protein